MPASVRIRSAFLFEPLKRLPKTRQKEKKSTKEQQQKKNTKGQNKAQNNSALLLLLLLRHQTQNATYRTRL